MREMIACPQCGLRHTPRENGLCPKCSNAISGVQPIAAAAAPAVAAATVEPEMTAGRRAAGILLLLNAAVNLASMALLPHESGGLSPVHAIVIDAIVGGGLLTGKEKWHKWAFVRAILGGVLYGAIFVFRHDYLSLAFQLMLSTSLTLLLLGKPGTVRIATAAVVCVPYFLMVAVAFVATKTGSNPLAASALAASGSISPSGGTLRGTKANYCLELPKERWYLRDPAVARKDNELADRWAMRPDFDAHVMVIAEEVPGAVIPQDQYESAIEKEARNKLGAFHMIGRDPIATGAALHYSGTAKGMRLEYYRGAFADGSRAYQVVAFAKPETFEKIGDEITGIVKSFHARCDGR
jgi:hypothetical protein